MNEHQPQPLTYVFHDVTRAMHGTKESHLAIPTTSVISTSLLPASISPSWLSPSWHSILRNPYLLYVVLVLVSIVILTWLYHRLRRYKTASDIPQHIIKNNVALRGVVTAVRDGDNFRFYHRPGFWVWKVPSTRKELRDNTIHVRIAGVDAPEGSHFGMPAQPYASEAKDWLLNLVLHKDITIIPYSIDRYGRLIAMAYVRRKRFKPCNVSLQMVKTGFATVYTGAGAQYGGILKELEVAETQAKRKRKGMWAQGMKRYVSPAEHKRLYLQNRANDYSTSQ